MRVKQALGTSTLGVCSGSMFRRTILIVIPLLLSGFTHLWNIVGFPSPAVDEGTYLGRAMSIQEGFGVQDPYYGYDHPFFGQLFLSSIFSVIGYPDSLSIADYARINSLELLFLVPRTLMGLLAVFDTFLVYMISERRYNTTTAFIAATLFAVMPITWLTRWILLDSIQLPFLLLSILFAMKGRSTFDTDNRKRVNKNGSNNSNDIIMILLSGIFLGLAIFTKVPAFIMILPIGYLILLRVRFNSNALKMFFLWLAPVILIPLTWPLYAISVGQFDNWLFGVYEQANRESMPLSLSIRDFFQIDPILLILGISGIILAAIRKDFFIILLTVPYTIFLYFIGFVTIFHLLPLVVGFSIASGALITDLARKIAPSKKLAQGLTFVTIAAIGLIGILNTSALLAEGQTSQYFEAASYVNGYMQKETLNGDDFGTANTTIISSPFYLWIPKYKFHLDNYMEWGFQRIDAGMAISVIDDAFRKAFDTNKHIDRLYKKIYNIYDTSEVEKFEGKSDRDSISILLTNLSKSNTSNGNAINLLDADQTWEPATDLKLSQNNNCVVMMIDTNNTGKKFNRAVLNTDLNYTQRPLLLSLEYSSNSSFGDAAFLLQIREKENDKYWTQLLDYTSGHFRKEIFVLPDYIGKAVEIRLTGITNGPGQHTLVVKEADVR